jgi:hypothetical protein
MEPEVAAATVCLGETTPFTTYLMIASASLMALAGIFLFLAGR